MKLQWIKVFLGLFTILIICTTSYVCLRWWFLDEIFIFKEAFNATKLDPTLLKSPLILAWTTYFSHPWAERLKKDFGKCAYHCIFTDNKEQLSDATAVLFHIRDLNELPELRHPKQLFVFVLQESPLYTYDYLDYVKEDYFNLTMTYRYDSDIYMPYGMMKKITKFTSREKIWNWTEVVNISSRKVQPVLQLVSNCETKSKRELYVQELRKFISVTQHGRCNNSTCDRECEIKESARHRFYLAFENSICRDYVTEKLFKSLLRLLVPVVLKKSIYKDILPSGSFIAANDFKSPRELAKYLIYLSSNNTAYLSYLKWTMHYQKTFDVNGFCELCKYLHGDIIKPRIIPNIRNWWFQGCNDNYAIELLK